MVVFGWLDLYERLGAELFLDAAVRAGSWLEQTQTAEGRGRGSTSTTASRMPTTPA